MSLALLLRETSTLKAPAQWPNDIGLSCFFCAICAVPSPQARTARSGDLCNIGTFSRTQFDQQCLVRKTNKLSPVELQDARWLSSLDNCGKRAIDWHRGCVDLSSLYAVWLDASCLLLVDILEKICGHLRPRSFMPGTVNLKRLCASRKSSFLTMSGRPLEFVYLSCRRDTAVSLQAFWTYCEAHLYSHSPHFDILPIGALVPQELGWGGASG